MPKVRKIQPPSDWDDDADDYEDDDYDEDDEGGYVPDPDQFGYGG